MYKLLILVLSVTILNGCVTLDKGDFGTFKRSLNNKPHGYIVVEDPTKTAPVKMVEVFEVRPGDCGSDEGWSDCKKDRERSELSGSKDNYPGDEYWYGWSIYFPEDYPNIYPTKTALGQFHQKSSHPVWMFQNSRGGYHLDDQVGGSTRRYYELIAEAELRGKWHKIELNVRWSKNDDGFFKAWVDGVAKVDYKGQTMDAQKAYFKYGIYRSFMSRHKNKFNIEQVPAQTVYYSNVKRGESRDTLLPTE
ncbi:MAG: polysaccharide lyase [Pseudomonadales bacterium]|nr:polysaccharide lyase [Pseudomonadales bacterium]